MNWLPTGKNMLVGATSLDPSFTRGRQCLQKKVSGQKSEPNLHFTAKLRLLTHPLTFLLVKQPQIFKDGNYYELIKFTFTNL